MIEFDYELMEVPNFDDIPSKFNEYQKIKELGKGGLGIVVSALNIKEGKNYACKFIYRHACQKNPLILHSVEKETRIQQQLNHPNVEKLHTVLFLDKFFVLILELCEDSDLYEYFRLSNLFTIERSPSENCFQTIRHASQREIYDIGYQLAQGLTYLHQKNIAHCDLKLENLLLTRDRVLKIADFGSCVECGKSESPSITTILFSPPELFLPDAPIDPKKIDIWAFGLILLILGLNYFPFGMNMNWDQKMDCIRCAITKYPIKILVDVIGKCLVQDPAKRICSEDLFICFQSLIRSRSLNQIKLVRPEKLSYRSRNMLIKIPHVLKAVSQ